MHFFRNVLLFFRHLRSNQWVVDKQTSSSVYLLQYELLGAVRKFAMKKYKCHRTVPTQLLNEVTTYLKKKKTALELRLEQGRGKAGALNAKLIKIERVLEAMSGLAAAPLAAGPP